MLSFFKRWRSTKPEPIISYPEAQLHAMKEWLCANGFPEDDLVPLFAAIYRQEGKGGGVTLQAWNTLHAFVGEYPKGLPPDWDWRNESHNSNMLFLWSVTQWFQQLSTVNAPSGVLEESLVDALEYTVKVARFVGYDVDVPLYPGSLRDNFARTMGCDTSDASLIRAFKRWGAWSAHVLFVRDTTVQLVNHPSDWVLEDEIYLHSEITLQF